MSHQDLNVACKADCLKLALQWLFSGVNWSSIRFRDDCSWSPRRLCMAGLFWSCSNEKTLDDRFRSTRKILHFLDPDQDKLASSYQAFMKMLTRWTTPLVALLLPALRRRMRTALAQLWHTDGWLLFGVDGSRIQLPRTKSHEAAYSAARKKKKKKKSTKRVSTKHAKKANSPQMWITTLWHAGTSLPWAWRTGPADSSERAHLLDMLPELPAPSMIAADAGFVGYENMQAILEKGHNFLIRVGANVRLLRELGFARESQNTVYLWPDKQAKKHAPPIVLRLIVVQNGKHPVYLVTNVLSAKQLSAAQVVRLYRRRWGIEVFFRSLKQTYERRKLHSKKAEHARVELDWSMVSLWAMALYALVQVRTGEEPKLRVSIAGMLRGFRHTMRDYRHPRERGDSMRNQLKLAVIDNYERTDKTSRDYPFKKKEKPPDKPKILLATNFQKQQAIIVKQEQMQIRLTA